MLLFAKKIVDNAYPLKHSGGQGVYKRWYEKKLLIFLESEFQIVMDLEPMDGNLFFQAFFSYSCKDFSCREWEAQQSMVRNLCQVKLLYAAAPEAIGN
jgi:hypothetical protein